MCIDSALYNGRKEKRLKKTTGKRKEEEDDEDDEDEDLSLPSERDRSLCLVDAYAVRVYASGSSFWRAQVVLPSPPPPCCFNFINGFVICARSTGNRVGGEHGKSNSRPSRVNDSTLRFFLLFFFCFFLFILQIG